MQELLAAMTQLADPFALFAIVLGSIVGIVFGAIPGLTYTMALALVLPLTFKLEPAAAIAMMISTYIGGMNGGSVSAVLIGIPGTPSAAVSVIEGYQMARQGRAGLALGIALLASAFGGLFSLLVMMFSVDLVARLAIKFGPVEIFALVLFGMSTICGLAERSLLRGMIAGVIGLMLMTIGLDEMDGVARMTFDWTPLLQGVNLVVAMVGLFAIPQLMQTFMDHYRGQAVAADAKDVRNELPSLRMLAQNLSLMIRCSIIGTIIGAIPGTGGPIASFLAYDHTKRFARNKEGFGKGRVDGLFGPEAANNAVTGGTMIPLLSLGIPGDAATAVMLGGLLIHGIQPGPLLFTENKTEVYVIYLAILLATIVVTAIQYYGIRAFIQLLRVPPPLLAMVILVMCVVGTFAIRNSYLDVVVMAVVGLIGYLLMRARIPIAPIVLGLVLGPTMEKEFRTALILSEGDYMTFLQSVPAAILFALTLVVVGMHFYGQFRESRAKTRAAKA
jgi:putative tricarboxylic transport membrane protein